MSRYAPGLYGHDCLHSQAGCDEHGGPYIPRHRARSSCATVTARDLDAITRQGHNQTTGRRTQRVVIVP